MNDFQSFILFFTLIFCSMMLVSIRKELLKIRRELDKNEP